MDFEDDAIVGTPLVLAVKNSDGVFTAIETGLHVWFDVENGWVVLPMDSVQTADDGLAMIMDFVRQEVE